MPTRIRKSGAGRPAKHQPKHPLQKQKMTEVMAYLAEHGWTKKALATQVFEVKNTTLSNWCTGEVKIDVRTKNTFAYVLHISLAYWDDPDMTIDEAIRHTPHLAPVPLFDSSQKAILGELLNRLNIYADDIKGLRDLAEQIHEGPILPSPPGLSHPTVTAEGKKNESSGEGQPEKRRGAR